MINRKSGEGWGQMLSLKTKQRSSIPPPLNFDNGPGYELADSLHVLVPAAPSPALGRRQKLAGPTERRVLSLPRRLLASCSRRRSNIPGALAASSPFYW